MAMLEENEQSKLFSFVLNKSLLPGSLTTDEQKAIDHLFGKIIKEWP